MRDHHAFGPARRTGGVDHVSGVAWRHITVDIFIALAFDLLVVAVDTDYANLLDRNLRQKTRLRDEHFYSRVIEQKRCSLLRIGSVQRNIRSTCFENREQANEHLGATFQADSDERLWPNAKLSKISRQLICTFVKFSVRDMLVAKHDCGGFWRRRSLLLKCVMNRIKASSWSAPSCRRFSQSDGQAAQSTEGQAGNTFRRIRNDCFEQDLKALRHLFNNHSVEEVGVVLKARVQFCARFGHHEREIKLCDTSLERQRFQLETAEAHSRACFTQCEQRQPFGDVRLVHREHDLKERRT